MADNVPITAGSGTIIGADDIGGGVLVQRVKPVWGPDGTGTDVDGTHPFPVQVGDTSAQANVLAGDTGQNSQLVAGSRKEVTFTTTTVQAVASTDVSNYRWFSVHITSQGGSSNVTLQGSNDNTNWVSVPGFTSTSTAGPAVNASSATGVLHGPIITRYFRLNVTGIASGTTAGVIEFFAHPAGVQGFGVDTELPAAAALADGASNPTTPTAGSAGLNFNGTNWDREKSATAATGTTGTGLAGTGVLGWDGTNYQRLNASTTGNLLAGGAYTELTGSASANTTDLVASTDVRQFCWLSLQLAGAFSATVAVQGSNDGTTWTNMPLFKTAGWDTGNPTIPWTTALTAVGIYCGPVLARYVRVRTTAYTSGTATATLELAATGGTVPPPALSLTVGALSANPQNDAITSMTGFQTAGYVYNGTNWDRVRGATSAHGTTGTGLPGVGELRFDGTNFRRVRSSLATSAHTAVGASVTSVSLLAANSNRESATFYNDSASAYCYLKLGATASTTSFTYKMAPGAYYELPMPVWAGAVDGIWDAAVGNMRIGEFT